MNLKRQLVNVDYWLIAAICALSVFGIICIGSATHINLGDSTSIFYSQILWFIIGLAILFFVTFFIDYTFLSRYYILFYLINIILLVLVLLIGREANNAKRWISFGPASIQPSEFAKIIMVFCLAKFIDKNREKINNITILIFTCISVIIPIVLIQMQPSLSASLVLLAVLCVILFVAGLNMKIVGYLLAVTVPVIVFVLWDGSKDNPLIIDKILRLHQLQRIRAYINPEKYPDLAYQTLQSIKAIGSGRLQGKGLYHGTLNQLSYLPEPHNDFIFSIIGEEFGFIGCIIVLLLLFFIVFRCILIAMTTRDTFGQLIAAGIAGMLAFQTLINVGVATGVIPNTGMPLPFVSYGGSSMWTNMASIGLVLNIGLRRSRTLFEGV